MNRIFAYLIIGAMILGVLVGWGVNQALDADQAAAAAKNLNLITDVFLRLIKMIIAPWSSPPWWRASPTWRTPPRSDASASRP